MSDLFNGTPHRHTWPYPDRHLFPGDGGKLRLRRIVSAMMTLTSVLVASIVFAGPAHAAPWYYFKPGHPMMQLPGEEYCTGSWAVTGTDGMFFLTAGHCNWPAYNYVYGTDDWFGAGRRNETGVMDAQLVQPRAGVDAQQIVVARNWPGGTIGRTVGLLHNSAFNRGDWIGKSGRTTGWTEGTILGQSTWTNGERVFLATYDRAGGDSGGPVLINNGAGEVWAAGMHVGRITSSTGVTYGAFISIDDLLSRFGARLPVFARSANSVAPTTVLNSGEALPFIRAVSYGLD